MFLRKSGSFIPPLSEFIKLNLKRGKKMITGGGEEIIN